MSEKVYTVKEIAEIYNLHIQTVRRYIKSGDIDAFKIGGSYRVEQKSLDRWVNSMINKKNKGSM